MEAISDLNTFAKILIEKGYVDYFFMQGVPNGNYGKQLKERLSEYVENCRKGVHRPVKPELLLKYYLDWSGEDRPWIECHMWVKHLNGKFFLNRMKVAKKDSNGQLIKQSKLADLNVVTVPNAVDAIALVNDAPKQKAGQSPKRFRR